LENIFSQIRRTAGRKPNAIQCLRAIRLISISQFLSEIKSTNYCSDSDEFLVNLKKKQPPNLNAPSTSSLTLPTCSSTYTEHNSCLANENILHYIVNSRLKKSMCIKCANWLHSEHNNHCDDMFRYMVQSEILKVYIFQVAAVLHLFEYVNKHLIAIQNFYFPISLQRQHTFL
jgi:hypothetical protein